MVKIDEAGTRRTSLRLQKNRKIMKELSSESDEENEEVKIAKKKVKDFLGENSSGSDFETELVTKKKVSSSEESEYESGTNEVAAPDPVMTIKSRNKKRKRELVKKDVSKNNISSMLLSKKNTLEIDKLNLSDSSHSDDEEIKSSKSKSKKKRFTKPPNEVKDHEKKSVEINGKPGSSKMLENLANNILENTQIWRKNHNNNSNGIEKEEELIEAGGKDDINKLLKMESANKSWSNKEISSGSDEDWEDVEEVKPALKDTSSSIQITLEAPEKKKRKELDVHTIIRREINRKRRELQERLHKAQFVCYVAHARFLNKISSSELLCAIGLSVIPVKFIFNRHSLTLIKLKHLISWFKECIIMDIDDSGKSVFPYPLIAGFSFRLENMCASSNEEAVIMFLIILRSLGLNARLIINFDIIPLKPPQCELLSAPVPVNKSSTNGDNNKSVLMKNEGNEKSTKNGLKVLTTKKSTKSLKKSEQDKVKNKEKSKNLKSSKEIEKRKVRGSRNSANLMNHNISNEEREEMMIQNIVSTEDESEIEKKKSKKRRKPKRDCSSDEDFQCDATCNSKVKKITKQSPPNKKVLLKPTLNYWIEVYIEKEKKWHSVDIVNCKVNCEAEMEKITSEPMIYVIGVNADNSVKDLTPKYSSQWLTKTKKLRAPDSWIDDTLTPYKPVEHVLEVQENNRINKALLDKPFPKTVSGFKNHPLYALRRHLLKFEEIYPPDAATLGFIRSEPIYSRDCVKTMHARETWMKEGRCVKLGEKPYKIVKARPKWHRASGTVIKDLPLEIFGYWQTEIYVPPPAKDGKVPRNEYGNVEIFQPWMLPKGTTHLPIPGLSRVARKLQIDCAPAMVGWDFSGGANHPVFEGFVVCTEFKETLLDAWNSEVVEKEKRENQKRENRILGNWRRLVKGLLVRERLKFKYTDS